MTEGWRREPDYDSSDSQSSSFLDPSDIIERFVDSDASDLSQQPSPIQDLDAEVSRLLDHHSSSSDSDDADGNKEQTASLEAKPTTPASAADLRDCTSRRAPEAASESPGHTQAEEHPGGGAAVAAHTSTSTPTPLTIHSTHVEGNGPLTSTYSREATNLAIQRLQSSESVRSSLGGSGQGSLISSSSQLSDECTPRPLAEELEEADKQEKLKHEALLSETGSSSEFYSSEEESGGEGMESDGWPSSEEIDFELQEEDSSPQETPTGQESKKVSYPTVADAHRASSTEQKMPENKRLEVVHKEPVFKAHARSDQFVSNTGRRHIPKHSSEQTQNEKRTALNSNKSTLFPANSPHTKTKNNVQNGPNGKAATLSNETLPVEGGEAQQSHQTKPSPPPMKTAAAKQPATNTSSGLDNLLPSQTSKLWLGSRQSAPAPSERSGTKGSSERVRKHPVNVKRFAPRKKHITSPLPSRARRDLESSGQTTLPHTRLTRDVNGISPKMKAVLGTSLQDLLSSDSDESLDTSSESEVMLPTANKPAAPVQSIATGQLSEALPKSEETARKLPLPLLAEQIESDMKQEGEPNSDVLPSVGSYSSSTAQRAISTAPKSMSSNGGLKSALVGISPSPAAVSSPCLPLKGILKKRSRFGSATSTNTDITTVTPLGSDTSSNNSQDDAIEKSTTLLQSISSAVGSLSTESVGAKNRTWSSVSSSDDGGDLDRTLTEEPTRTANTEPYTDHQPKREHSLNQLTHMHSDVTFTTSEYRSPLLRNGPKSEETKDEKPFRQNSVRSKPLTSSPITAHRPLEEVLHAKLQTTHLARTSSTLTPPPTHTNQATTQPTSDGTASEKPDGGSNRRQTTCLTLASDELNDRVKAVEQKQVKMEKMFAVERKALWDIILEQNQLLATLQRKRRHDQEKITNARRHMRLLEGKLEEVEAGVVRIGRAAISQQRMGAAGSLADTDLPGSQPRHRMGSLVSTKKLAKLTKFFGDTPPILKHFLEKLGYEEHIGKFTKAGIGLPELPHITDEQLKQLGIPLGHRARILQEAQKLSPNSCQ